jgi:hypothetical protein
MPPFQYTRPVDPYVGSIAQLMGQRGQTQADAAERIAAIRAQEATQRGEIWGGAIQGIGETIGRLPADYQAAKDRQFQEDQQKRLLEGQERLDTARKLYGKIQGTPDVQGMEMVSRPGETIETTLPATFGYPDARGGMTQVAIPAETEQTLSSRQGIPTITNPYRELNKDGIQSLDLWDIPSIEKVFAEQELGIEGQQYIEWMENSNTRMEEHHANALAMAGDSAKRIISLPSYPEMLNATETLLEKFKNNGVFSARDLESFGSSLANIKGMPGDQQETALKGLLVQMIPGGEETMILGPDYRAAGALTGRTIGSGAPRPENLTGEEQALDAYARFLYPEYRGLNPRHILTDEDRVNYAQRSANITRSPGTPIWTASGLMRPTVKGYVPVTDVSGNQLQPRDTSPPQSALTASMTNEYKAVIDRAVLNVPAVRRSSFTDSFNRAWEDAERSGDRYELNDLIRYAAVDTENVQNKERIVGRMATVNSLRDVRNTLERYAAFGEDDAPVLPTNWLLGNIEKIYRSVGVTQDPRYVELANRLMGTLINYRRAATGVQFGQLENQQYLRMFPTNQNIPNVNLALIDGLLHEMDSYDSTYWRHKLGERGARLIGMIDSQGVLDEPNAARGF